MNNNDMEYYLDLLLDEGPDGLRKIALSTNTLVLQWHGLPADGLRKMRILLEDCQSDFVTLRIGTIFHGAAVWLVRREGIISFKITLDGSGADLMVANLPDPAVAKLKEAVHDAIEDWEDI